MCSCAVFQLLTALLSWPPHCQGLTACRPWPPDGFPSGSVTSQHWQKNSRAGESQELSFPSFPLSPTDSPGPSAGGALTKKKAQSLKAAHFPLGQSKMQGAQKAPGERPPELAVRPGLTDAGRLLESQLPLKDFTLSLSSTCSLVCSLCFDCPKNGALELVGIRHQNWCSMSSWGQNGAGSNLLQLGCDIAAPVPFEASTVFHH